MQLNGEVKSTHHQYIVIKHGNNLSHHICDKQHIPNYQPHITVSVYNFIAILQGSNTTEVHSQSGPNLYQYTNDCEYL